MLDSLAAHPPQLVLDTSTASNLGYENYPTSLIPELDRFIHDGYQQVASVDGVDDLAAPRLRKGDARSPLVSA